MSIYLERGKAYQEKGLVKELVLSPDGTYIRSSVQGTRKKPYKVEVTVSHDNGDLWIDGTCTCPVGANCKHVTATLWEAMHQSKNAPLGNTENAVERWLGDLDIALQPDIKTDNLIDNTDERLIYILTQRSLLEYSLLQVEPCWVRPLRNGGYSKPRPLSMLPTMSLMPMDSQLLHWLEFSVKQYPHSLPKHLFPLTGHNGVEILQQLLATGRCHWASHNTAPLTLGETRQAQLEWQMEPDGLQHLQCRIAGTKSHTIAPLTPPWYIDHSTHQCGPLETGVKPAVAAALIAAPPLKPEKIREIYNAITERLSTTTAPLPKSFTQERVEKMKPIPCLRLLAPHVPIKPNQYTNWRPFEVRLPLIELSFRYNQARVLWDEPKKTAHYIDNNVLVSVPRQITAEKRAIAYIKKLELPLLKDLARLESNNYPHQNCWVIGEENNEDTIKDFSLYELPKFREAGWEITIDSDYPYHLIDDEVAEWYSEIDDNPSQGWFNLELGITLQGERINLLPLLLQLIERFPDKLTRANINTIPEHTKLLAQLPDGRYLPVPIKRVRSMLSVLTELYDTEAVQSGTSLRLSRLRAGHILELEKGFKAAKFRWLGGESLRELGRRLQGFSGIKPVETPEGFQTTLRAYQQEGLSWLQFLREYQLAGILADDMGLGKTVQALAHLLVEKNSGRMDRPSLVIAPTSLMFNWRMEAERFAPGLKILVLHGSERKPHFTTIKQHDVILTTYPLLVRDQDILLAEPYHLLILDEAQIIKNPKAKATQIVYQIEARHRLCMTGTPMENHLGELWSLFHFLLPGLLGEHKQFGRLFRVPIEKFQDHERQKSLSKRIGPFMLRRAKKEVLKDLPEKTEIIRSVELEGVQRDLYESIRIAMHEKVADIIREKGLSNSRIIILDALLKLRQICCDPRLLKLPMAKKLEAGSAKLNLLMEMLPSLLEEGRRILLFSQFTEMLELIEQECHKHQLNYVKLTGKTKDREAVVQAFQSGSVPLFLISLKAGGTGLNLTAADTVIHYDPWWNPAVEQQATDRAHRIGQESRIFVYKLMTIGTVEEKILVLQNHKRMLFDGLFSEQTTNKVELSLKDLEDLFAPV